jgi:RimJ/RimL family protein N-acetyltransferase
VNPKTGEPFLRLLSHKNIIITPPRLSDAPLYVPILNDERVIHWLSSPPYPYLLGKLDFFLRDFSRVEASSHRAWGMVGEPGETPVR